MKYKLKLEELIEELKTLENQDTMQDRRFDEEYFKKKIDEVFNSYQEDVMSHLPEWL